MERVWMEEKISNDTPFIGYVQEHAGMCICVL